MRSMNVCRAILTGHLEKIEDCYLDLLGPVI